MINTNDFRKPFDYQLKIAVDSSGASAPQKIDLVETFNYLIGLRVIQQNRQLEKGYLYEEGTLPNGDLALILWRDCDKVGDEDLNKLLEKLDVHPGNTEYQVIYVNGDHAVPNVTLGGADNGKRLKVLQIENVFLEKMFEETK
jgi:adenine-specific DNA-methyltransferase